MKTLLIIAAALALSTPASASDNARSDAIDGLVDHVLVSLPSDHFEALSDSLSEHLVGGWFAQPDQGKGFIVTQDSVGYIEFWDAGRAVFNWPLGSQVAITTPDIERGRELAESFYDTPGRSWAQAGAPQLVTVCPGDMADPLGGTFFVSYGPDMQSPTNPGSPLTTLEEIVTVIPDTRLSNNEAYTAFGFTEEQTEDGAVYTDSQGTRARIIGRDFFEIALPGHALLRFRLAEPVSERRVEQIVDGSLALIYEDHSLTLVLSPDGAALAMPEETDDEAPDAE